MSLWTIAWKSIRQRGVASALTTVSMALGVMLVTIVLTIHGVVTASFRNNTSLGYNMIVGAKGGSLQLTLNTVYYLSDPVENIPYDYYLEFKEAEQREREWRDSIAHHAAELERETIELNSLATGGVGSFGLSSLASTLALDALADAELEQSRRTQSGRFGGYVDLAIPLCLGDFFHNYRVVGTTSEFFDELVYDTENEIGYEFAQGRNFEYWNEEHGFFEAVVGATVAREKGVKLGDKFEPAHGEPGGQIHENKFTIVGILEPSGTPNDRAVFVNMEGFFLIEDHIKPVKKEKDEYDDEEVDEPVNVAAGGQVADEQHDHDHDHGPTSEPLPIEQREVTSILVRMGEPIYAEGLKTIINEGQEAQAAFPIAEIYGLLNIIVRPIQYSLLLLTAMICIVSGVSILVSIYNSMNDRRHEIAVMRALGAGRSTVMSVILFESIILSVGGGFLGWVSAHVLSFFASGRVEEQTGVSIGLLDFAPPINIAGWLTENWELLVYPELTLIPSIILLAVIVGFWPAMSAYHTDVAESLGK